jgi:hypothetical protein
MGDASDIRVVEAARKIEPSLISHGFARTFLVGPTATQCVCLEQVWREK